MYHVLCTQLLFVIRVKPKLYMAFKVLQFDPDMYDKTFLLIKKNCIDKNFITVMTIIIIISSYHLLSTHCGSVGLTLYHKNSVRGCLFFR